MKKNTNTNERRRETTSKIRFFALAALILTIGTAIIIVTKAIATQNLRNDGKLVTITSYYETEPHRETISMWNYDNDYSNEHYTNIEYYEYSGTFIVEVSTYDGEELGKYEINPKYSGEDKIFEGAEIEKYKLQPIKKNIEKVAKETTDKEVLQEIKPVKKQERNQTLVRIKDK